MVCVGADSASITEAPKGLGLVLEQGLVETFALGAALLVAGDGRGGQVARPRDQAFPQGPESRCLSCP